MPAARLDRVQPAGHDGHMNAWITVVTYENVRGCPGPAAALRG
ncbi:hypothetical protein [Actinomadura mexicana]|nr:hypothetical protein [Actinomadura mexicana]